jgi:hypothetical protein
MSSFSLGALNVCIIRGRYPTTVGEIGIDVCPIHNENQMINFKLADNEWIFFKSGLLATWGNSALPILLHPAVSEL